MDPELPELLPLPPLTLHLLNSEKGYARKEWKEWEWEEGEWEEGQSIFERSSFFKKIAFS